MTRNELRDYFLSMTDSEEEFPFGPEVAVFKVMGKMFGLLPVSEDTQTMSIKCDPIEAVMLREMYNAVQPGYHLNKKHWNTVTIDGELNETQIKEMIEDSYTLVRQKLTKKNQAELAKLEQNESTS